MPTSDAENKDIVIRWYKELAPKTVVDIGAGEGTYFKLINSSDALVTSRWTAIEAWAPYVTDYKLGDMYNNVIIADAFYLDFRKVNDGITDLIIAGDVLEHMTKVEAKELIATFKKHSKNIIISIPLLHLHQEPYKGNWFERHIDHWSYEEMCSELGEGLTESLEGPTLGYFLWRR